MAKFAGDLIARLAREGELNLDDLSLSMAVEVAAQVVGLTSSVMPRATACRGSPSRTVRT